MTERVIRKRAEVPFSDTMRLVHEPGDIIVLDPDGETREERWLTDVMAIAGPTGQMRRVHEKCLALAPFHMLHSQACQEPGPWQ